MATEDDVIAAAAWLRDNARDPDVAFASANVIARAGCRTMAEYARSDPEGLIELADALIEMKEQIPDDELRSAKSKLPKL